MNRKNPGLAEIEPMSRDDELGFYRYSAVGWTIAVAIFTVYAVCRGVSHHWGTTGFGWLMAAWAWGVFWYERRKKKQLPRR